MIVGNIKIRIIGPSSLVGLVVTTSTIFHNTQYKRKVKATYKI